MLLDDVATLLTGLATVQKGTYLETPDTVLALRETGGFPSTHVNVGPRPVLEEPTVQVIARAKEYAAGSALAWDAHRALTGTRNQTINGRLYHWIDAMQPPFLLERDATFRYLFAFNVHLKRSASSS